MTKYRAVVEFRAHSHAMRGLISLYSLLDIKVDREPDFSPIVVFMAFSIEAYINTIGAMKLPFWEHVERLPWRTKLLILHDAVQARPDWGKGPLQFVAELFQIRDNLAHGKPEAVLGPVYETVQQAKDWDNVRDLRPKWLAKVDRIWIAAARNKHEEFMTYLAELSGVAPLHYLISAEIKTVPCAGDA